MSPHMPSDAVEAELLSTLTRHYESLGHWDATGAAQNALSLDGMRNRLSYVQSRVPARLFSPDARALVSGMGAGGEMLVVRERGVGHVFGVEVDELSLEICRRRFAGLEGLYPRLYDGESLPFDAESFDLLLSGHIIEHTGDPRRYLAELVRVLRPAGWLFLEFPTRFHGRELHTGLPSVEWLPRPLRNGLLRLVSRRSFPVAEATRKKCRTILETGLKQISTGRVRRWLSRNDPPAVIVDVARPAPGVVRCLIRKRQTVA